MNAIRMLYELVQGALLKGIERQEPYVEGGEMVAAEVRDVMSTDIHFVEEAEVGDRHLYHLQADFHVSLDGWVAVTPPLAARLMREVEEHGHEDQSPFGKYN